MNPQLGQDARMPKRVTAPDYCMIGRVLGARDFQIVAGPGLTDDIRWSVPALRKTG